MSDTAVAQRRRHLTAVPNPGNPTGEDAANATRIEQRVLGTAMESATDRAAIADLVTADSFANPRHGDIWTAIMAAAEAGEPTDAVAITERLIRNGTITKLPAAYVVGDLYAAAAPGQGEYWARLLAERHTWRRLNVGQARLAQAMTTPGVGLDQVAHLAETIAATATEPATTGGDTMPIAELAAHYVDTFITWEPAVGLATPWHDLNALLTPGGFERCQVVTFGGATGMGKSVALTNLMRHYGVESQIPTLFFTLEMTHEQVLCRVLADVTGVPERAIKRRELSEQDMGRVGRARQRLDAAPLWIVSGPRSLTQIANETRRHRQRHGDIAVVGVDYAQIVIPQGRPESRQVAVADTMKRFKQFALAEDVLVVTAAQVNRAPAHRPDKRPTLADLRESGEIEQTSDVVVLLFREEYYDPESPRAGEVDFIVAKQRGGPTDTITLASQLWLTRFVSMADA